MERHLIIHTHIHTYIHEPSDIHPSIHPVVLSIWDGILRRWHGWCAASTGEQHPIVGELWIGRPFLLLLGAGRPPRPRWMDPTTAAQMIINRTQAGPHADRHVCMYVCMWLRPSGEEADGSGLPSILPCTTILNGKETRAVIKPHMHV